MILSYAEWLTLHGYSIPSWDNFCKVLMGNGARVLKSLTKVP